MLVVSAIARVEVPSALWRKARTGELEDADAGILISAFELDFHGGLDSDSRFTIVSLTETVLIAAAKEAASDSSWSFPPWRFRSASVHAKRRQQLGEHIEIPVLSPHG